MIDKKKICVVLVFLAICIIGLSKSPCVHAENLNTGIVLTDDKGTLIYGQNSEKPFIPASVLKILTSLAAVQTLGGGYRFPTEYFFDEISKNLYIKGYGDPLFVSEVIEQLCHEIGQKTHEIHNIILDQTYFSGQIKVPGKSNSLNPYDAPVGALCANFNTFMFKWDDQKKQFISGETQTPLLSIFHEDIKKTRLKQGRIVLSKQQSLLYPGLLIKHFLEKSNINVTGSVLLGAFDVKNGEEQIFLSPFEIKDVVQKLLKYSNNYIANQLFLTIGTTAFQAPATLEKGIKAVKLFSKQSLGLDPFIMLEGSGLSRSNLISPVQMIKILLEFMPFHSLLNNQGKDFFKTGTLTGVRTRAGYILGEDNRLYPYAIMVNQENKSYDSIRKNLLHMVFQMTKNQD